MAQAETIGNWLPTLIASLRRITERLRVAVRTTMFGPAILEALARVGYATRGLVYFLLGSLAVASALSASRPPSLAGAYSVIDHLAGGWLILLAVAAGLCAHGGWRLMQALLDLSGLGWRPKGLFRRAGILGEAVLYAGLGTLAAIISLSRNAAGNPVGGEATFAVAWTARILDWPLGHWMVGAVGALAITMAGGQLLKARRMAFGDIDASGWGMTTIRVIGWIGFAAKSAILAATGVLFLIAAWQVEASGVGGMRAAFTALSDVPLGDSVLFAISAGLALHGVFNLIKAWRHKPVTP